VRLLYHWVMDPMGPGEGVSLARYLHGYAPKPHIIPRSPLLEDEVISARQRKHRKYFSREQECIVRAKRVAGSPRSYPAFSAPENSASAVTLRTAFIGILKMLFHCLKINQFIRKHVPVPASDTRPPPAVSALSSAPRSARRGVLRSASTSTRGRPFPRGA